MKKIFALLLAIVMVIGMAACNQQPADPTTEATKGTEAPKATDAPETTEAPEYKPLVPLAEPMSEKLVIGLLSNVTVLDYHDNYYTKYIEEKTGVDIDFMFFAADASSAKQQLNLMVAGNEKLPDILFGSWVDATMRAELGADGYLLDLKPYFESEKWYYGKTALERCATEGEQVLWWVQGTSPDGGMYGYPSLYDGGVIDEGGVLGGINKNWAEKFGMNYEEIDTIAEVKEFLQKALSEDPNGNGKADELGVIQYQAYTKGRAEVWLLNAYVRLDDVAIFNVDDGELWAPQITDEYRKGLIELNSWYKEGLISSLAYTIADQNEEKALLETPECYTVALFGGHPTRVCNADSLIGNEYGYIKPLADETGKGGYGRLGNSLAVQVHTFITADCENPDLAFAFLDYMYASGEMGVVGRYGEEGIYWEKINGEMEIDGVMTKVNDQRGYPAGWRGLPGMDEWSKETKQTWHLSIPQIGGSLAIDAGYAVNPGYGGSPLTWTEGSRNGITYGCCFAQAEGKQAEEKFYNVIYNAEETEIYNLYWKPLLSYIVAARAEFITGVKDPNNDADWNAYLAEMEANGLSELMETCQEAYTRTIGSGFVG